MEAAVQTKAQVRPSAQGLLVQFLAAPGQRGTAGTQLVLLRDATVALEERVLKAMLAALQAKLNAAEFARVVEAKFQRGSAGCIDVGIDVVETAAPSAGGLDLVVVGAGGEGAAGPIAVGAGQVEVAEIGDDCGVHGV